MRHDAGKEDVEGGTHGEAALHGLIGRADGTTEIETAKVGFGVEFKGDRYQVASHGTAHHVGFGGLAILPEEIAAQRFGFGIGLLKRPTCSGIGALDDGVVAFKERHLPALWERGDVKGHGLKRIAVIEDDECVVPVRGNVDAVRGAVEQAYLGDA